MQFECVILFHTETIQVGRAISVRDKEKREKSDKEVKSPDWNYSQKKKSSDWNVWPDDHGSIRGRPSVLFVSPPLATHSSCLPLLLENVLDYRSSYINPLFLGAAPSFLRILRGSFYMAHIAATSDPAHRVTMIEPANFNMQESDRHTVANDTASTGGFSCYFLMWIFISNSEFF